MERAVRRLLLHELQAEPDFRGLYRICLLYTSDAADERSSVDLGGRRIIKKNKSDKTGVDAWSIRTLDRTRTQYNTGLRTHERKE